MGTSFTSERVYFDHNATTPVSPLIQEKAPELLMAWGNPSSIHASGRGPKSILRETRNALAKELNCHPLELIFNSGASEGNTTVLESVLRLSKKKKFLISAVEHPSVLKTAEKLSQSGAEVEYFSPSIEGHLDLEKFKKMLTPDTALVSMMLANNEFGSIFPISEMAKLAHEVGALFHSDCVQGFGKIPVNLQELGVDYATFSAHKFYSVKGTGFLYAKKGAPLESLIYGGGQERGRRAGTENTFGIGCLGLNLSLLKALPARSDHMRSLRDHFEKEITNVSHVQITAGKSLRLPNTSSIVIDGIDGEVLLMSLDVKGYAVSTGAACSSGSPEPSPALLALGLSRAQAQSSLRVSFGYENTLIEVENFLETLKQVIDHLRQISLAEASASVSSRISKVGG